MPDNWYRRWNHHWYHLPRDVGGTRPPIGGAGSTTIRRYPSLVPPPRPKRGQTALLLEVDQSFPAGLALPNPARLA